jgi:hypothetical protein
MNLKSWFTKEYAIRFALIILIVIVYMMALRPARAYLSHEWVKPMTERFIVNQPDVLRLETHSRSVSFRVEIINQSTGNVDKEIDFGFPWGFYLVFPLVLLVLFDRTNKFTQIHVIIQFVLGILMLLFFLSGVYFHYSLLHVYKMFASYVTPGAAFLIILFVFIQDKKLIQNSPKTE